MRDGIVDANGIKGVAASAAGVFQAPTSRHPGLPTASGSPLPTVGCQSVRSAELAVVTVCEPLTKARGASLLAKARGAHH